MTRARSAGCRKTLSRFLLLASLAVAHPFGAAQAAGPQVETLALPDAPLVDQEGRAVRFVSDVLGEGRVIVNFIYTRCTTACPLSSATLAKLQKALTGKRQEAVRLVSISLDPRHDTPQRLKAYAETFKAGPNWLWLTGHPADVQGLVKAFGVDAADISAHAPVILLGDGRTGRWRRINGFPTASDILKNLHQGFGTP